MKKEKKKESRVTEKALYVSLFAMTVSCAMLFESTYAWFTQTVSTPVSVIQTGSMSAKLVVPGEAASLIDAGEDAETEENNLIFREYDIVRKSGSGSTVFEPGKSYCLPEIYVQNTGNIDLSYTITLGHNPEVTETALSLYDVLDFVAYVRGENDELDLEHPISLSVARGDSSTEGDTEAGKTEEGGEAGAEAGGEADGESAAGNEGTGEAETGEDNSTERMVAGVLEAPAEGETVVSKGFVIQATMKPEAGIEYSGLELSGLQIIVNTTQIIPDGE